MTKPYAIRCSTEEQARECMGGVDPKNIAGLLCNKGAFYKGCVWNEEFLILQGLEIISYDEAISLGLFGEKKEESPSEDNLVEKILNEVDYILRGIDEDQIDTDEGRWETSTGVEFGIKVKQELKDMIKKHLSSK